MIYSVKTDPGLVRPNNEDSACIVENKSGDLFLMVLDGMGGHCRGDARQCGAAHFVPSRSADAQGNQ